MLNFTVTGMTCGGCINAVTRAIQSHDSQAEVKVDLATQYIELKTNLSKEQAQELIEDAGFPVQS
jgi:copper chaperone